MPAWAVGTTASVHGLLPVFRRYFGGIWLFGCVLLAQVGHLVEHISVAIQGHGLLGQQFDSELSHFLFNGAIAALAAILMVVYPRNPWVYPLFIISIFHWSEHVYIFSQYVSTGISGRPGLLGAGGLLGIVPLPRTQLHNIYNGLEVILLTLGFNYEAESILPFKGKGVASP